MSGIDVSNTGIGVGIAICTCAKRPVTPEWRSFPMICKEQNAKIYNIILVNKQLQFAMNNW